MARRTRTITDRDELPALVLPELPTRALRVLQPLENPAGGIWPVDSVIPWDALTPASIAILMERQIVMVYLSPEQIAALPLDAQ